MVGSWLGGENRLLFTPYRLKNDDIRLTRSKHVFYLTTSDIRTKYLNSFDRWHFSEQSTAAAAAAAATTHIYLRTLCVCVMYCVCAAHPTRPHTHIIAP